MGRDPMIRDHAFKPGHFQPDRCQVMLARYRCPYTREEHTMPDPTDDARERRRRELARITLRNQEVIGDDEATLAEHEGTSPWRRALATADALLAAYPVLDPTTPDPLAAPDVVEVVAAIVAAAGGKVDVPVGMFLLKRDLERWEDVALGVVRFTTRPTTERTQ